MQVKLFCTTALLVTLGMSAYASPDKKQQCGYVQNTFSDSVQIHCYPSKKNCVRLYPNPTSDGIITVNSNSSEPLHFYIFDLEGVLISRVMLGAKEHKTISDLKKGTYMYDVFKNDESIEQGKIIVK